MSNRNKKILIVAGIALLIALFIPLPLPCKTCNGSGKLSSDWGGSYCPICKGDKIQFRTIFKYLNG